MRVVGPVEGIDIFDVFIHYHHRSPRAQVPDASDTVQACRRKKTAVPIEAYGVDFSRVAFLEEEFGSRGDVPETPRCVERGGSEVLTRGVEVDAADSAGVACER